MYAGLTLVTASASEPISVAMAKAHGYVTTSDDDGLVAGYISAARRYCEKATNRALLTQTWRLALREWPTRDLETDGGDGTYIELPRPPLQSITSFTYDDVNGTPASMTASYTGAAGNYILDAESEPGRIYLPFSGLWPTTILAPGAPIKITYKAGYQSYSGTVAVDSTGKLVVWNAGDKFPASLAGTFIDIGSQSSTVLTVTDDTHLILASSVGPQACAAYSANLVPHAIKQAMLFLTGHFYENREMVVVGHVAQIATEIQFSVNALLDEWRNFHPIQEL